MSLRNVKVFGAGEFDINVTRDGYGIVMTVMRGGQTVAKRKSDNGKTISIKI